MSDYLPEQSQTPFAGSQYQLLNQFLPTLTAEQSAWLAGFLTHRTTSSAHGSAPAIQQGRITILVGSQSGNSQSLAEQAAAMATSRKLATVIKDMNQYKLPQLKTEKFVLIIVSTYGEGDPPDSAREIYDYLFSKRAPELPDLQYAVLALGDSSYEFFCKTGADFDHRLEELGAKRLHPRVDCDVDYESSAEHWIVQVLDKVAPQVTENDPAVNIVTSLTPQPKLSTYSRKHPFPAQLLENIVLNGRGAGKETRHYELSLQGSDLTYEPGDALGIYPTNATDTVEELISTLRFSADERIIIEDNSHTILEAFTQLFEITTLTRPMLQKYAALINNSDLSYLLNDAGRNALNDYLSGRQLIDLINDFPCANLDPQSFVDCLRKLPPRLYSIASSLKEYPDEVHLTVATVRYHSHGRQRQGVCSTFLADRIDENGQIPVYVEHNKNFKLPNDPSASIIMVGPGTGIAPFRAFIQERDVLEAPGKNWLFFGDQHFTTDFLYQTEWQHYLKSGLLTRMDVAFSRDQQEKCYVQHRLLENSREIYAWLQEGAYFYVCGDEKNMAHDVDQALVKLIAKEGGLSHDAAKDYLRTLQKDKRYQRDVY
jgi:sulfite reductase (NADPH) flavoprotein alpha-component